MPLGGGLAIGANVVGGIVGGLIGGADRRKAARAMQAAYDKALATVGDPELARELVLQEYGVAGQLSPEQEKEIFAGPSKVESIEEDPMLREAQTKALQGLVEQSTTGLNATDRAALNSARQDVQRDAEAKRQQIMQNFAARGQGGTANELVAAMQASQAGTEQASAGADRQAAIASERALQALMQSGQLGGQIRGQDFDVNKTRASAADEIAKFNVQNAVGRESRNVGSKNQAQQFNITNAQDVSNRNVGQSNQESANARNIRLSQAEQKANLMLGKGKAKSDALNKSAASAEQMAKGIGSGISQASTAGIFGGGASSVAAPSETSGTGALSGYDYNKKSKDFFGLGN